MIVNESLYFGLVIPTTTNMDVNPFLMALMTVVEVPMMVFGMVANPVVVFVVLADSKMRHSAMNVLLVNLALVDTVLVGYKVFMYYYYYVERVEINFDWILPSWMCPAVEYTWTTCLSVAICTFVVIAVERYIVIVHPLRRASYASRRRILQIIAGVWLFCLAFKAPELYAFHLVRTDAADMAVGHSGFSCSNSEATGRFWYIYNYVKIAQVGTSGDAWRNWCK